ncbi:MAG: amidohydrolase/deacetylase family metallohydrolase [Desulfobacteraceae bacterium]|nr:amidohydrolase/deacetylase family metallohydrolase [Desulfobacteraceae bacterium]
MYDLLIKNGRVIDPAQQLDDRLDIAINGDKIACLFENISPTESNQVINAQGKIVTPGLIDSHCHVYSKQDPPGTEPDTVGVNQGVTMVVDGGSAGQATFDDLKKEIATAHTTVYCLLHIGSLGQKFPPELRDWEEIDLDATAATIQANRDLIRGIKIRLLGDLVSREGVEVVKTAQKIAKRFDLPLVVHMGDLKQRVAPTLTQETLPLLESGDILTHLYNSNWGGCMRDDGTFLPELRQAMQRGVILDIGRGRIHFSFEVAKNGLSQGILPTTISSDIVAPSITDRVYGLTAVMSTLLELGLKLAQVIEMSTINPARALSLDDRIGSLKPGMVADISILNLLSGKWTIVDSEQKTLTLTQLLSPDSTIKSGIPVPTVEGLGIPPVADQAA